MSDVKRNNILYYPVLHGIGDMLSVMAYALQEFNGESFTVVGASYFSLLKEVAEHYKEFYLDIVSAVDLCEGIEFLDLQEESEIDESLLKLEKDNNLNVVSVPWENKGHGYDQWRINNLDYQINFKKFFNAKVDKKIEKYIKKDRINICFQLRRTREHECSSEFWSPAIAARNVDVDKWINFLLWVADNYNVNLIGIGDSDKSSPWYISEEELKPLIEHEHVHMPAWEQGTSLLEDMYFIQETDLFIGTHSGPQHLAWLLSKPSICFDFGLKQRIPAVHMDYQAYYCAAHQKVCWGKQSLDEMKLLFSLFINGDYPRYAGLSVEEILHKQEKSFDRKARSAIRKLFSGLSPSEYTENLNILKETEEFSKYLLPYKYALLSYRMGELCLKNKEYEMAVSFFDDSWAFVLKDFEKFKQSIEDLSKNGHQECAERMLICSVSSLDSIRYPELYVKVAEYIASYYKKQNRFEEADYYYKSILYVDENKVGVK